MASGRSLSTGGSYGRAQAVVSWALENWVEFDTWCCLKNLTPEEFPAYRFYNVTLYMLKEGMGEDQLREFEKTLLLCDKVKHPLHQLEYVPKGQSTKSATPPPESRHKYIPPWWRGEDANAQVALVAMQGVSSLPKMA